jgi:hypothetical protein
MMVFGKSVSILPSGEAEWPARFVRAQWGRVMMNSGAATILTAHGAQISARRTRRGTTSCSGAARLRALLALEATH